MLSDAVHFCVFVHRGKKASVFNYDPLTKNILIIKANTSNCVCEFSSNTVYMVKKKYRLGLLYVWAWKSCYVYTVEVRTRVYNVRYIDGLEVLMKVLCQIQPKQRLFVSSSCCLCQK